MYNCVHDIVPYAIFRSSNIVIFMSLQLQTHLTFGKEFTQAVELKQVAQQEAERARFLVEKVRLFSDYFQLICLN